MKKHLLFFAFFVLIVFGRVGWGQILINVGGSVSENFDGMSASATATLPTNWKMDKNTTVRTVGTYSAAVSATEQIAGTAMASVATNGLYNFGTGASGAGTDRAIGGLSSSTSSKSVNIYAWFQNSGAISVTSLILSYDVERYRNGSNAAGFSVQMYYSTDGNSWTSAGTNFLSSFVANADNNGGDPVPIETKSISSQTLGGLNIAQNGNLYLAWNYSVTSGSTTSNSQALSIDNFTTNSLLPVELTSFSALTKNKTVNLNWQTATEVNNYGFEIERGSRQEAIGNSAWTKVGFVNGAGNSNSPKEYSFTDKSATSGKYVYRLKQLDNDGQYKYSKEVEVEVSAPLDFSLAQNYPNPFNPSTSIQYSVVGSQNVTLKVFNVIGKEVAVLVNEKKEPGTYTAEFSSANLSSGTYFYRLQSGAFIQTKKMIILK